MGFARRCCWSLLIVFLALAGQKPAAAGCRNVPKVGLEAFDAPGTHAVGVRTVTFVDTSRPTPPAGSFAGTPERTLVTEMWYPALQSGRDAAVDIDGGPYPVVIYSHGGGGRRLEATPLGEHLASRGMIAAAPDFPLTGLASPAGLVVEIFEDLVNQPGDWSFVLDGVLATFGTAADPARVGATGFSFGGITTVLVTYHRDLRDPRIRAALPLAPSTCFLTSRFYREVDTPMLIMHGDSDQIARFRNDGLAAHRRARGLRYLVRLENGSHLGFIPFAAALDPAEHYDRFLCETFFGPLLPTGDGENPFQDWVTPLGDREVGISTTLRRCIVPCSTPVRDGPSMPAERHHQLARATVAAFFQASLLEDTAAHCFLRRTLAREADVKVRSSGAR